MKARITFSLLGIQLGSIDLNLDLDVFGSEAVAPEVVASKVVKKVGRLVARSSEGWMKLWLAGSRG